MSDWVTAEVPLVRQVSETPPMGFLGIEDAHEPSEVQGSKDGTTALL